MAGLGGVSGLCRFQLTGWGLGDGGRGTLQGMRFPKPTLHLAAHSNCVVSWNKGQESNRTAQCRVPRAWGKIAIRAEVGAFRETGPQGRSNINLQGDLRRVFGSQPSCRVLG